MSPIEFVYLTRPTMDLKTEYLSFYEEWKDCGEAMIPWVISREPTDFQSMIQFLLDSESGENLPENWVPSSTYWLVSENKKVIGAVNIRHSLTNELLNNGGHIGYGIRPSERKKGYATKLLSLALEKAKGLGIEKSLIVCSQSNIGSNKVIVNNGGTQDSDYFEKDGTIIKRYWIN